MTGQRINPPEFDDCSPLRYESMNTGHDRTMIRVHAGSRKNTTPKISIQICLWRGSREDRMSTRTCSFFSSV
ncbi:Uncharacterised protein [Bordetella pertussis]|nr:Uncharacterised protein [Bordetella pertussis]